MRGSTTPVGRRPAARLRAPPGFCCEFRPKPLSLSIAFHLREIPWPGPLHSTPIPGSGRQGHHRTKRPYRRSNPRRPLAVMHSPVRVVAPDTRQQGDFGLPAPIDQKVLRAPLETLSISCRRFQRDQPCADWKPIRSCATRYTALGRLSRNISRSLCIHRLQFESQIC